MTSRSKKFTIGAITGYTVIAANMAFTMVSIPLSLHYLKKEEFGLWVLVSQISGYLNLVDLGMNGAASRFIADHKDNVNGGLYGAILINSGIAFIIQGMLVMILGMIFSLSAGILFAIPRELYSDFKLLIVLSAIISGFSVALRIFGTPLWAFQRSDIVNVCTFSGVVISIPVLFIGFKLGLGIYSFLVCQLPLVIGAPAVYIYCCLRHSYYPKKGSWGSPTVSEFKKIFNFGKDNFIISLGSQMVNASQLMIISRFVGLDAAATFAIGTKIYGMAMLLVVNPISVAAAGLTEIYVSGDYKLFTNRYKDLIVATLGVSTFFGIVIACGNSAFIFKWTHGRVEWPLINNLFLALLLVIKNINGNFIGVFGITKDWKPVRFYCLLEGLIFITVGIILSMTYGIVGVLVASLLSCFIVTIVSAKTAEFIIGSSKHLCKPIIISTIMILLACASSYLESSNRILSWSFFIPYFSIFVLSVTIIWKSIISVSIKNEVSARVYKLYTGLIHK